jgi:seryl-tRNA synthetase
LDLAESVDRSLLDVARAAGARRRAYGSLIQLSTMARCEYLRSFPQNAYLVAELPHDWRTLERVDGASDVASLTRLSEYMLSPAVCFHCYEELAGRELPAPLVLTAIGTCFRHEAAWRVGGPRLREFSMREIVFYGDAGFVDAMRARLMDQVWACFERLGLSGRIETASDPFYLPADSVKAQYQLMASTKYELVACLRGGEEVVLGSFNDVGDTLCGPFGITCGGTPVHSGCVALGIQRWVYALRTRSFQQ